MISTKNQISSHHYSETFRTLITGHHLPLETDCMAESSSVCMSAGRSTRVSSWEQVTSSLLRTATFCWRLGRSSYSSLHCFKSIPKTYNKNKTKQTNQLKIQNDITTNVGNGNKVEVLVKFFFINIAHTSWRNLTCSAAMEYSISLNASPTHWFINKTLA